MDVRNLVYFFDHVGDFVHQLLRESVQFGEKDQQKSDKKTPIKVIENKKNPRNVQQRKIKLLKNTFKTMTKKHTIFF